MGEREKISPGSDGGGQEAERDRNHPSSVIRPPSSGKVEASVARCLRTPPDAAKTSGLQDRSFKPLTRPEQPEHSCRWQLLLWPDNGGTIPSKSPPFTPSSILFRPRNGGRTTEDREQKEPDRSHLSSVFCRLSSEMVEAPGTAPGSDGFIATAIYRHSRLAPALPNIGAKG
jgi:hypothetical protein